MDTYHMLVSDGELKLIQRDIINDFLKLEGNIKLDVDILVAKLSLMVKFMKISQHKNLKDFEYLHNRIKTSRLVAISPNADC